MITWQTQYYITMTINKIDPIVWTDKKLILP